jgi:hypothetical protein
MLDSGISSEQPPGTLLRDDRLGFRVFLQERRVFWGSNALL